MRYAGCRIARVLRFDPRAWPRCFVALGALVGHAFHPNRAALCAFVASDERQGNRGNHR